MAVKGIVAGKDSSAAQSFTFDREADFNDWRKKREKSQRMIGLMAWLIVMTIATMAGFLIGFISKI